MGDGSAMNHTLPEEVEAYRDLMWRREPERRVEDAVEAERLIETVGFCAAMISPPSRSCSAPSRSTPSTALIRSSIPLSSLPPPPIIAGFSNGSLAWAPDGRRLAAVSADTAMATTVWIVDPDAAAPYRKLIELPAGPRIRGIAWTRDGSAVVVGRHETSSHIVMLDQTK